MKTHITAILAIVFISFTSTAQLDYLFTSGGLDPKIAITGTDNSFTQHPAGINYLGKLGLRFKDRTEVAGYFEIYDDIGYRAVGMQYNYAAISLGDLDFLIGGEISIISRLERTDGFNERWLEYYPSFGINAETRWMFTRHLGIGWIANYKTRPDILPYSRWDEQSINFYTRFSTYVQVYFRF